MKTIYKDNIWRQIIHFVKEERWDGEYTRETDLVKDLQLKGDDAYEFICLSVSYTHLTLPTNSRV